MPEWLNDPDLRWKLIASAVVVVAVLVLRAVAGRFVRRTLAGNDAARLSWLARLRLVAILAILVGLVFVWATQLQTLALSVVAFAAAIVLATKELILCITGGLVRNAGGAFEIGDRVEIGAVKGDVIGYGILTTTILETGPAQARTGRAVTVPNSLFVNTPVINESFTSEYVLHTVRVPLPEGADAEAAERVLLDAAGVTCAEYVDDAERRLRQQAEENGLPSPNTRPRVLVQLADRKAVDLLLRYPVPIRERSSTEQSILRQYLAAGGAIPPAEDAPPA